MTRPSISADLRYDRQIRLWGADTQKALQSTYLYLHGAQGEASELAKNLVLAGVKGVGVTDPAPIVAGDAGNNFLIRRVAQDRHWDSRGEAVAASLRHLNPEVRVTHARESASHPHDAPTPSSLLAMCVHAIQLDTLTEAYAVARRFDRSSSAWPTSSACSAQTQSTATLLLLSVHCTTQLVVTLCLHTRHPSASLTTQLDTLLRCPATLSRQHAVLQQAVLTLHLNDHLHRPASAPSSALMWRTRCARGLLTATQLVSELHLCALTPATVAAVVSRAHPPADAALDASTATLTGATLAQFVVRQIAAHVSAEEAEMYGWIACDGGDDMAVLVGEQILAR